MLQRRDFLATLTAAAAASALAPLPAAAAGGLDPQNPNIKFGTTGSYFGKWNVAADGRQSLQMSDNVRMILTDIQHYGLEGFEPYAAQVSAYASNPGALKVMLQETGIVLASVGGTVSPPAPAAGRGRGAAPANDPGSWLGGSGRAEMVAQIEGHRKGNERAGGQSTAALPQPDRVGAPVHRHVQVIPAVHGSPGVHPHVDLAAE